MRASLWAMRLLDALLILAGGMAVFWWLVP